MPRSNPVQPAGVVFHVPNRGNERRELFDLNKCIYPLSSILQMKDNW